MTGTYIGYANPSDLLVDEMVMKAWVNECGGSLAIELSREQEAIARGESPPFNKERFETTSRLFKEAGMDASVHIAFRSKELFSRCNQILWRAISSCNPEWFLDAEERQGRPRPRFTPPNIDRLQLEIEATESYLRERAKRPKEIPLPKTGEVSPEKDITARDEPNESTKRSGSSSRIRKGNLPAITFEDIARSGLTSKQVAEYLTGMRPELLKEDDVESLSAKLSGAASRVASSLPKGKVDPPMRVQKSARGLWSFVALTEKG